MDVKERANPADRALISVRAADQADTRRNTRCIAPLRPAPSPGPARPARSAPVHALLVPCGRHGDARPFLAPGRAPRARGRRVTLLINGDFGPLVRRLGFAAAPPGEANHFEQALRDPDLRHPRRGPDCAPRVCDPARCGTPPPGQLYSVEANAPGTHRTGG
jgi:hypothetical protein